MNPLATPAANPVASPERPAAVASAVELRCQGVVSAAASGSRATKAGCRSAPPTPSPQQPRTAPPALACGSHTPSAQGTYTPSPSHLPPPHAPESLHRGARAKPRVRVGASSSCWQAAVFPTGGGRRRGRRWKGGSVGGGAGRRSSRRRARGGRTGGGR